MTAQRGAVRAYQAASAHRSLREREAEVFLQVNAGLQRIRQGGTMLSRVRALADNDRLWLALVGALRDPANRLPDTLRGSLISVGLAVQREMRAREPDLEFLIEVNANVAAWLAGHA